MIKSQVAGTSTKSLCRHAAEVIARAERLRIEALTLKQRLRLTAERALKGARKMGWEIPSEPMPLFHGVVTADEPVRDALDGQRELSTKLHDDVAQLLALCEIRLSEAQQEENVRQARQYLNQVIATTRSIIEGCQSSVSHPSDLLAALDTIAADMAHYGLEATVSADDAVPRADEHVVAILCRSVRELLFNIVKHAGVLQARVVVSASAQDITVQVIDQGRGFCADLRRPPKAHPCFGLSQVRERVTEVGGSVKIRSQLGKGTNVTLVAPTIEGSATIA